MGYVTGNSNAGLGAGKGEGGRERERKVGRNGRPEHEETGEPEQEGHRVGVKGGGERGARARGGENRGETEQSIHLNHVFEMKSRGTAEIISKVSECMNVTDSSCVEEVWRSRLRVAPPCLRARDHVVDSLVHLHGHRKKKRAIPTTIATKDSCFSHQRNTNPCKRKVEVFADYA
eukprot:3336968-Pleurochrysis_carterae.AAC.4